MASFDPRVLVAAHPSLQLLSRIGSDWTRMDSSAIPVPGPTFQGRYPHFYPQADTLILDKARTNSVHNRDGDIFVNNSRLG